MTHRSATPSLESLGIATGLAMFSADALAVVEGDWPRWVKVTPRGDATTRDGRRYIFEPERLVARFATDGIDIPIDIDHAISKKPMFGDRADAAGWIKDLQSRDDGLYALVDLLDAGRAALAAKTHRYVSPTFHHTEAGLATWLHSVALVAAPALAMAAIAAASPTTLEQSTMLKEIAKALGLADSADEAACLSAISGFNTRIDKAVHDQALANLSAANEQVTTLQASLAARDKADHQAKVDLTIEGALAAKKIVPAQREKFQALCATAEGLTHVQALLDATPAGLQASDLDARPSPAGHAAAGSDELLAAAHTLIETAAKSGRTLSLADAVVQANNGSIN